jgi:glycosyltransferase involved in cell wall biosynthesis
MNKKKLYLGSDILSDSQNEISDSTSLKRLKRHKNTSTKKRENKQILKIIFKYSYFIISFFILIIIILLFIFKNKSRKRFFTKIDRNSEYNNVQEYYKMIQDHVLYDKGKIYNPSGNPKISIILPVYNGEAFLQETLISIQNQDFKDIEIIIIDDKSTDNSTILIKELMKTEPRISFYQNEENKGPLYTKKKGILAAKGKYVMIIDDDDKFLQRDAFTSLYEEAEKFNLDILEFKSILSTSLLNIDQYNKTGKENYSILYQNELNNYMYFPGFLGVIEKYDNKKVNHFVKTILYVNILEQIDDKYFNIRINYYEDYMFFFLLTRNAKSLKKIDRIFYLKEKVIFSDDSKKNHRKNERLKEGFNYLCFAYLNYIQFLFDKTKNTVEDKKIAFSQLEKLYLDNLCKSNPNYKKMALNIIDLFLNSEYISLADKKKIRIFLADKK